MQKKDHALDKALRSLALRAHSEKEIMEKLMHAGYDEREIAKAMAKLIEYNLLDDAEFAAQWAASRARRGLGQYRIAQELRQKGIDPETAGNAMGQIDEEVLLKNATELAEKHLRRGGDTARRRAFDALIRRGFGYALAKDAVEQAACAIAQEE